MQGLPFISHHNDPLTVQVFNKPGSYWWIKPTWAKIVWVQVVSAGAGGGSGYKDYSLSYPHSVSGGGGGASGGMSMLWFNASDLSGTEPVYVGRGGPGGVSQSSEDAAGNVGNNGEASYFGSGPHVKASATSAGTGGQLNSQGAGGSPAGLGQSQGISLNGSAGGTCGNGGTAAPGTGGSAGSGGAGGGFEDGTAYYDGANGGRGTSLGLTGAVAVGNGGAGGIIDTTIAEKGKDAVNIFTCGSGGGGGGAIVTTGSDYGVGGNGGYPGGGGGGGGMSVSSFDSGAGGNGADGRVIVICW